MKRTFFRTCCGAALLTLGSVAQALTTFEADVNSAIDDGLAFARNNNYFTNNTQGNGLTLLALLQKESIPAGYAGLSASDQTLADASACLLMTSGTYGARASFYSYYDGQTLMALSVYVVTGGPDNPTACPASSVRATIDKVVDRSLAAQTPGAPATGTCSGYWSYVGNGCDSSTTQFTAAGLSAAKNYYSQTSDPGSRIVPIDAALTAVSNAYKLNAQPPQPSCLWTACGAGGCAGHGYQALTYVPSWQQTASGDFLQLMANGKNVNDSGIQQYLQWLRNGYSYSQIYSTASYNSLNGNAWNQSYFYYLWSSSKGYDLILKSGVLPAAGNIGPADMGTLPGLSACGYTREVNRDPSTDTRPPTRGAGGTGYYSGAPTGFYYDYAYRLMTLQNGAGQFGNPQGSWGYPAVDQAYALLVLERSVGGAYVPIKCDANQDSRIDKLDLAIISRARRQPVTGPDDLRDGNGDGVINPADIKYCTVRCTSPNCATAGP
jgi:hypothetical protein